MPPVALSFAMGQGGRGWRVDHARSVDRIGWTRARAGLETDRSARLSHLFVAPEMAARRGSPNVALDPADHDAVVAFAKANAIDFVIVGPDAPVVAGLGDDVQAAESPASALKAAGQAGGSKGSPRRFATKWAFRRPLIAGLTRPGGDSLCAGAWRPIVVKADGLALGKGVTVAMQVEEAERADCRVLPASSALSGASVVIGTSSRAKGETSSSSATARNILPLATAQDHKRAFDGDMGGPNTGGMGAYSPAPVMTPDLVRRTLDESSRQTLRSMAARGTPGRGCSSRGRC